MTTFTDEFLQFLATLDDGDPEGAHTASLLARELLQLRQQITPQAGEAEPVGVVTDAMVERGCIALKAMEHPGAPNYWADTKEGSWKDLWRQKVRAAINAALSCHPAPPRPVCPHIRSSKDGTSWCDLAASVGDLSPGAGTEQVELRTADLPKWKPKDIPT